mmetsp:Transcript_158874/g.509439  ORF Transcript_158874/g.509439 Transcript_158874/m.509439 type:complete len:244 (+) Transcript_158874:231-962(+)
MPRLHWKAVRTCVEARATVPSDRGVCRPMYILPQLCSSLHPFGPRLCPGHRQELECDSLAAYGSDDDRTAHTVDLSPVQLQGCVAPPRPCAHQQHITCQRNMPSRKVGDGALEAAAPTLQKAPSPLQPPVVREEPRHVLASEAFGALPALHPRLLFTRQHRNFHVQVFCEGDLQVGNLLADLARRLLPRLRRRRLSAVFPGAGSLGEAPARLREARRGSQNFAQSSGGALSRCQIGRGLPRSR